ncbi:MAG: hypothetical protein B7Y39_08205 [Bdellovibrio sp. 28-41-41]|nr:MAG: hypothetical protein B7Y39_08205 [Bdellovibrio sp. 28-41-41]
MSEKSFLTALSSNALDEKLKELISGERELLTEIIIHICEVDARKMYLDFGYSSLFDYLTERMGYANGSAQRRIDAARLSRDVPEVINHIESGDINLSQISVMAQAIRQVPKGSKVSKEIKEQMVADLCEKTVAQSEILVSCALNIPIKELAKTKHQKDESIRLEVTFSKTQWEKLTKARDLLSHLIPDGSWDHIFEYMSEQVIQKKDKTSIKTLKPSKAKKVDATASVLDGNNDQDYKPMSARKTRAHIPLSIQRQVLNRDKCCQYHSKITHQKCGSSWKLTIDHIKPLWADGSNELENLRVLCAAHNNKVYHDQAGIRNV